MPAGSHRARTLTEALRALTNDQLTTILQHRMDLSHPRPRDLAELAARSTTTASIARSLDQLNAWTRLVAEGLAALPDPSSLAELARLVDQPVAVVAAAVQDLRDRAMVWGEDDQLHLVRPVREAFEPYPLGLAPPSARPLSPEEVDAALGECDDAARAVLDRLTWAPTGAVRNAERTVTPGSARTPIEQLLARRLLRPLDSDTVIAPREVAWRLRAGRLSAEPVPIEPPRPGGRARDARLVDRAASGAAFGLLHDVELVAYALEATPHRLLRTGGLGTRDTAALARELGTDIGHATFVVECAAAAGLVGTSTNLTLLPTPEFDRWLSRDGASRWRVLAAAWLAAPRFFSRSAEPGSHALGPEAEAAVAPNLRSLVVELSVQAGTGTMPEVAELARAAAWHRPRLARGPLDAATVVGWTWREGAWLGLNALAATSSFASLVLAGEAGTPAELAELFPRPVEQIIIQADLTGVAPGPLTHPVAAELRMLADQESRGGGGVFRFSATSLRRAFDAGWSSDQVHDWLRHHSSTTIPQPLTYLVDDVARRHGTIRVGTAASYLRVEDEAQAAAMLAHPHATALGLRLVAPGVLVADAEASEVVALLRDIGHTPAVEDARGQLVTGPARPRANRRVVEISSTAPAPAAEVAAALLAAERHHRVRREPPTYGGAEEALSQLRTATREAASVVVGYVTADGTPAERELSPLDMGAGTVRAVDLASAQVVTIPLARISSVGPSRSGHIE